LEPAIYTLIGALGGILITQVANYFLESKKAKNQQVLKSIELDHQKHHDLLKERRIAYSNYLAAIDKTVATEINLAECVNHLYGALIVSTGETTKKIAEVFSMIKMKDYETDEFLSAKTKLLKAMQADLQN